MMKNNSLISFVLPFLLGLLLTSCKDDEKFSLDLDKNSLTLNTEGGQESIQLTSNGFWEIREIPEWLYIDPDYGYGSDEIQIQAWENREFDTRKATLVFVCENITRELVVEQLGQGDSFMELDAAQLQAGTNAFSHTIKLTTNKAWQLTDVPDWITASPLSGEGSAEITIQALENRELERRYATLVFTGENRIETFTVVQWGLREILRGPGLPVFYFSKLSYSSAWEDYYAETNNLFVNPEIRDKIYLGNLVSHTPSSNINIPEFTGYTFNPVTFSTSAPVSGEIVKTYTPSREDQDAFAQQIIAQQPKQQVSFVADKGSIEFYDYRRLYTLGMINLGIKLDEVVSGSSFREKETSGKYGLIFSFKQVLFTLDMDIPTRVIKEELREEDAAQDVSYVSSVSYGKVGLLIVESNVDSRDVRTAINKVIAGESLSQKESELIEAADISYVYFNNDNEVQVKKGTLDAIEAYKKGMTEEKENIYPVGFQLADFHIHTQSTLSFSLKITP